MLLLFALLVAVTAAVGEEEEVEMVMEGSRTWKAPEGTEVTKNKSRLSYLRNF